MNILSIESSADETAVSVVHADGDFPTATYEILGDALHSQMELHEQYGGIFPMMAKREHAKAILPLLKTALEDAQLLEEVPEEIDATTQEKITTLLEREEELPQQLLEFAATYQKPEIDLIAVTSGPGLEPALWVGVNFAKALALLWNIKVVPINHMEGHILASVYDVEEDNQLAKVQFPAISLLISGGHTELVLMKDWPACAGHADRGHYEKIGQTRDDAVGEAFDKVARMMGLPYPGGPQIGKLAAEARVKGITSKELLDLKLPRAMLHSGDLDFSFSGIKTAVRYAIEKIELTDDAKLAIAREFEDAAAEILIKKTKAAIDEHGAKSLIIGGGVSASPYFRQEFNAQFLQTHPDLSVYFPTPGMSTDNSIMIALSGHAGAAGALSAAGAHSTIRADGNKSLS